MGLRSLKARESQIERAIGDYFFHISKQINFAFYKVNVRGFFKGRTYDDPKGNRVVVGEFRKDQNPYALGGLADYEVVYRGMIAYMEVKSETGTQQPNQKEFEFYVGKIGKAPYFLVRSVDDAAASLKIFISLVDGFFENIQDGR